MNDNENRRHMYPTFDQKAVDEYAVYLASMAEAVQHHPALLAYDLFNEPQFNTLEYQGAVDQDHPQSHSRWKKQDICEFTAQWYDAIKGQDTNHLITLGGLGEYELEVWDMSVLHIDFYSLHIYPLKGYKGDWNMEQSLEQFHALLHWFGQVCPMPWIIGETAFSASDATTPPHTGPASPTEVYQQYHQWPYMEGTEEDQRHFAEWTLALTRQCGGSGWSWWYFQEFRWWDYYYPMGHPDGPAYTHADRMRGIYYAMLHPGDANADWYEKPAVDEVRNYVPAPMPEYPGAQPANYYNWNNLPGPVSYTGTIKDQHDQPIKNAQAWLRQRSFDIPIDPEQEDYEAFHCAVTENTGVFVFNTEPTGAGYTSPVRQNLILVAVGASTECHGGFCPGVVPLSGATHQLDLNPFLFDGRVEDLDLYSSSSDPHVRYEGWTDLELVGVALHGTPEPGATQVEFIARHVVHIAGEFHAEQGSEAHLFLEETFPDCADDSFKQLVMGDGGGAVPERTKPLKDSIRIELQFGDDPLMWNTTVAPNPFTNTINVWWDEAHEARMDLFDPIGRHIGRWVLSGQKVELDLGSIAAGPYLLRIACEDRVSTHTLIKQP